MRSQALTKVAACGTLDPKAAAPDFFSGVKVEPR